MYSSNLSQLVGSASEKFSDDIKSIGKLNKDFVYAINDRDVCCEKLYSADDNFKFALINGDKYDIDKKSRKKILSRILDIFLKIFLIIIFVVLLSMSLYKALVTRNANIARSISMSTSNSDDFYSVHTNVDDLGEKNRIKPVIYEIEPLVFFDSDFDGFGDLNGVVQKLDYIQNDLHANCILIKNIQMFSESPYDRLISLVDGRLGNFENLRVLANEARKRSLQVAIEIKIASTPVLNSWFMHDGTDLYITSKVKTQNPNETHQWNYDLSKELYYFGSERRAYLDFDNQKARDLIFKVLEIWLNKNLTDTVYIQDFHQIVYKNLDYFNLFIRDLKALSAKTSISLITNFDNDKIYTTNERGLFHAYKIEVEPHAVLNEILSNRNPFDAYLKTNFTFIWTLKPLQLMPIQLEQRRYMMVAFYTVLYSIPGSVLLKQGNELEYVNIDEDSVQIYRWNDYLPYSGFTSSNTLFWTFLQAKQSVLTIENGIDLRTAKETSNSLYNVLSHLNKYIKPFIEIESKLYALNTSQSIFQMNRMFTQRTWNKTVVFLLNFSKTEFELRNFFDSNHNNGTKITAVFDSTYSIFPFQVIDFSWNYYLYPNQYLILQTELSGLQ